MIGFGLNVNLSNSDLENIDQPVASLSMADQGKIPRQVILMKLISQIMQAVTVFGPDSALGLLDEFKHFDRLKGEQVTVVTSRQNINATYLGLESNGHVCVQTEQGVQTFAAADISLRQARHVTG